MLKGQTQIWAATLLIATSFTFGESIAGDLDPAILNLLRFVLAVSILAPFIFWIYGKEALPHPRRLAAYALISFCMTGFFWAMFEALRYTTALNTGTLFVLIPGIAAIYSLVLLGERLGPNKLIALSLGLFGALWVVFGGEHRRLFSLDLKYGDLNFMGGCCLMAAYAPLVKRINSGEPPAIITFWTLATGCFWLALFSNQKLLEIDIYQIKPTVLVGICYLAVFTTIASTLLFQSAAIRLGGNKVAAYTYVNPSLVLLIDWIIGKGFPPWKVIPGILLVLAATGVLQMNVRAKTQNN